MKRSIIEKIATSLKLIPDLTQERSENPLQGKAAEDNEMTTTPLHNFPPMEKWNHWTEYEATEHPKRVQKNYTIVPTTCFNCESACGLTAYVDKDSNQIRKFEGNPYHPGSRGRNCAKGPATINQITDPDRILYPLKRVGKRGEGKWEKVSWEDVLDDIAGRLNKAIREERHNEIAYHVGRPGHEGYTNRVLQAWGVDGHNSHTNICSSGARFGYNICYGYDRPSPDHANAKVILLISAHLESGHYFNPHAQRIIEAKMKGAKLITLDPRLSNTASMSDYWMPTYPGTEPAMLLAMAKIILEEKLYNRPFLEDWTNWEQYLEAKHPNEEVTFENYISKMTAEYEKYTPEFAEKETGVPKEKIIEVAQLVGNAGTQFSSHNWRSAASGNLGGWCVSRCLHFLQVGQKFWNELHFPKEYPMSMFEMSFLLPHFLKEGRGKMDVYFTRVFNPVWTYPDGFTWIEALEDENKIGLHIAMTPTWNETAFWADYVLPMGHSAERHDLNSYATHSGMWIAFRQPVLREAARRAGKKVDFTYEVNPGQVWEEDEFWIELSWRMDPDGSLGIRDHFMSPYRKGEKINIDEYYQFIFENTKGLPEAAAKEGISELEYMKKYGAFEVEKHSYEKHLHQLSSEQMQGAQIDQKSNLIYKNGKTIGVMVNGKPCVGFPTPTRKNEFYSQTMVDWGWEEYATPTYIKSHIHEEKLDKSKGEYVLLPTFRLPTLIHSRSGNAKWLVEISNRNPIWMHPQDATTFGVKTGDLIRLNTDIGYFVDKVWVTQGMKPGVIACSHHLGRWRRKQDAGNRWATNTVDIKTDGKGGYKMSTVSGIKPFLSEDSDSKRIFWKDGGVHQNITHAVHPDPISGMHCWHQRVKLEKPRPGDQYGDIFVDTNKSFEVYKEWLAMTRPAPGPNGLRRPLWFKRPVRPAEEMYYIKE